MSWTERHLASPIDREFSTCNLPYGIFSTATTAARVGVAIGDSIIDLAALAEAGRFDQVVSEPRVFAHDSLNPILRLGRATWTRLRDELLAIVDDPVGIDQLVSGAIVSRAAATLHRPIRPTHFQDFFSSIEHATRTGRLFRPDGEPLPQAFRTIPITYHGRVGTVVVSGTDIVRPHGMIQQKTGGDPQYAATDQLDFELELGFITGAGNPLGRPVSIEEADELVFGCVLLNDWSARDIQRFEYVPLGPYLGKSFATSISPWVVPIEALDPFRVPGPVQMPPPPDHLATAEAWNLDMTVTAELTTGGDDVFEISRANPKTMYWNTAQHVAHSSSNGAVIEAGDLYGTGTISGTEPGTYGCLMEATEGGRTPLELGSGVQRTFLLDGDRVTLRGSAGGDHRPQVGFGEVTGRVLPRPPAL